VRQGRLEVVRRSLRALASRDLDFRSYSITAWKWRIPIILGLGILLRVTEYLSNRGLWLDEGSLAANIRTPRFAALFGPLAHTQLAPPLFLAVEWLMVRALGDHNWAFRLFPLICGVGSLFLFLAVARRVLESNAVWVALALFALSEDLIYYSSEVKQYMTDVAAGLVCLLAGLMLYRSPATLPRLGAFAFVGALVVWFSHASAFVLAGVGVVLLTLAIRQRRWSQASTLALIFIIWLMSFAGVYAVSMEQLGHRRDMWVFWNFTFPPLPPSSLWDVSWPIRKLFYLFVNPLNFETPLSPRISALIPLLCCIAGCGSMFKRDRVVFGMLTAPIIITLLVAYPRLYPFHGRLLLFLVPFLLLLITEGWDSLGRRLAGPWLTIRWILLAAILLFPTLNAVNYLFLESRERNSVNRFGDRRPPTPDLMRFPF
jgi:hypothetical protein